MELTYELIIIGIMIVDTLLMTIIFISMVYRMYFEQGRIKSHANIIRFYRAAYVCCILFSIACSTIDAIHAYRAYQANTTMLSTDFGILKLVADFCYFAASNMLNVILFGRVKLTFDNTSFALCHRITVLFVLFIMAAVFCCFVYLSLILIFPASQQQEDKYGLYIAIVVMLDDIIVSIFLLYLFNSKLRQLIADSINTETDRLYHSAPAISCNPRLAEHARKSYTSTLTQTPQRHYHCKHADSKRHSLLSQSQGSSLTQPAASASESEQNSHGQSFRSSVSEQPLTNARAVTLNEAANTIVQQCGIASPQIRHSVEASESARDRDRDGSFIVDSLVFGRKSPRAQSQSAYDLKADGTGLSTRHLKLIRVITRHTVLCGFAIAFNQFFFVANAVTMSPQMEDNKYWSSSVYLLRSVGLCGIVMCLYLSTKFNKNFYLLLCGMCNRGCFRCCVSCTKSRISSSAASSAMMAAV